MLEWRKLLEQSQSWPEADEQEINLNCYKPQRFGGCLVSQHNLAKLTIKALLNYKLLHWEDHIWFMICLFSFMNLAQNFT